MSILWKQSRQQPLTKERNTSTIIIHEMIQKIMDYWMRNKLQTHCIIDITKLIAFYYNHIEILQFNEQYSTSGIQFSDNDRCIIKKHECLTYDYVLANIQPIFKGIVCWRIQIKNPSQGWILFGISTKQQFNIKLPSARKSLYAISFDGYYGQKAKNNNITLTHFNQKQCEIDMYLDATKGELNFCVVGMSEFYPQAKIWNIPCNRWIPHFMFANSANNAELQIARIENILYGRKCGNIFQTEKYKRYDSVKMVASILRSIEIMIKERIYLKFNHDAEMTQFEVKGDLEVTVNDNNATQFVIDTNINPWDKSKYGKLKWKLHPKMDPSSWKLGVLCLRDKDKKLRVGQKYKTSILKWKLVVRNNDYVPIHVMYWPEMSENGTITVSAQYECSMSLKNVIITFPISTRHDPGIYGYDNGDVVFCRNDEELQWRLDYIEQDNIGSLEYVVDGIEIEDLWPVRIQFEMENICFSGIKIKSVSNSDGDKYLSYNVETLCIADRCFVSS